MLSYQQKIQQARLSLEPSPHLVIDDFLDPGDLATLMNLIPEDASFCWQQSRLGVLPCWHGAAVNGSRGHQQTAQWMQSLFNDALADTFFTAFEPSLLSCFRDVYGLVTVSDSIRTALQTWQDAGSIDVRLPGNRLPVHRDWPNRLISVVLYLPSIKACESWGTRLYDVPANNAVDPVALVGRTIDDSRTVAIDASHKLIDFKANRLVAFQNTPDSFHSAVIDSEHQDARRIALVKGLNLQETVTADWFGLPEELR